MFYEIIVEEKAIVIISVEADSMEEARKTAMEYKEMFGDRIEVESHVICENQLV